MLGQVAAIHSIDWSLPSGPHFADAAACVAFAVDAENARSRPFSDQGTVGYSRSNRVRLVQHGTM